MNILDLVRPSRAVKIIEHVIDHEHIHTVHDAVTALNMGFNDMFEREYFGGQSYERAALTYLHTILKSKVYH